MLSVKQNRSFEAANSKRKKSSLILKTVEVMHVSAVTPHTSREGDHPPPNMKGKSPLLSHAVVYKAPLMVHLGCYSSEIAVSQHTSKLWEVGSPK